MAKKDLEAWTALAERLGLDFEPGGVLKDHVLSGTVDGLTVRVRTSEDTSPEFGSGNLTHYLVEFAPLDMGLKIRRRGGIGKFRPSRKGIRTGDEHFDRECKVAGDDPLGVRLFLTAARREALVACTMELQGFKADDDRVRCASPGVDDADTVEMTLQKLVSVAAALTR